MPTIFLEIPIWFCFGVLSGVCQSSVSWTGFEPPQPQNRARSSEVCKEGSVLKPSVFQPGFGARWRHRASCFSTGWVWPHPILREVGPNSTMSIAFQRSFLDSDSAAGLPPQQVYIVLIAPLSVLNVQGHGGHTKNFEI